MHHSVVPNDYKPACTALASRSETWRRRSGCHFRSTRPTRSHLLRRRKGVLALRTYQRSARRVYRPVALPSRGGRAIGQRAATMFAPRTLFDPKERFPRERTLKGPLSGQKGDVMQNRNAWIAKAAALAGLVGCLALSTAAPAAIESSCPAPCARPPKSAVFLRDPNGHSVPSARSPRSLARCSWPPRKRWYGSMPAVGDSGCERSRRRRVRALPRAEILTTISWADTDLHTVSGRRRAPRLTWLLA